MKQQTAVESIIQKLNNVKPTDYCSIETIKEWCEQAKAMEKEQIIYAYCQCGKDNFKHIKVINTSATEYYNETYGKDSTTTTD